MGAVTQVKNQGSCGSCWSFSATGAMEGRFQIKTGKLIPLSEQQLIDCSTDEGNKGCHGGSMDHAFAYAKSHKMDTEESYPYAGVNGMCHAQTGQQVNEVVDFKDVNPNDPHALMSAVSEGPVSVSVDGSSAGFKLYKKGILRYLCGEKQDHGALVVGYGSAKTALHG